MKNKEKLIIDLGKQPVSNKYLKSKNEFNKKYDFKLVQDNKTALIKIKKPFPVKSLKPKFDWVTYNEPEKHLNTMVRNIIKFKKDKSNLNVGGISFKDDSTLDIFKKLGNKIWRLDLIYDLKLKKGMGVESIQEKISKFDMRNILKKYKKADILVVRHIWEHVYDQKKFSKNLKKIVKKDGILVFEIPDCTKLLKKNDYTMPWEEHLFYYTPRTFFKSLNDNGMSILFSYKKNYPYEDIIYAIVKFSKKIRNTNLIKFNSLNEDLKLTKNYSLNFINYKNNIIKFIKKKKLNGKIAIFGAGHMAISFLNYFQLNELVDYVLDNNTNKHGLFLPLGNNKIQNTNILKNKKIKLCLLAMNPLNHKKVIKNYEYFEKNGGKFTSIFSKEIING